MYQSPLIHKDRSLHETEAGVGKAKKETGAGGERWRGKKQREGQCIRAGEGGERQRALQCRHLLASAEVPGVQPCVC